MENGGGLKQHDLEGTRINQVLLLLLDPKLRNSFGEKVVFRENCRPTIFSGKLGWEMDY